MDLPCLNVDIKFEMINVDRNVVPVMHSEFTNKAALRLTCHEPEL